MIEQVGPYRIELFSDDRLDGLLELERALWSPDMKTTADHFRWKFLENPYGTSVHFYLATLDDRVVGANGMYWSRWEFDRPGTFVDTLCRADTVIAPEHRGNGILGAFFRSLRRDLTERGLPVLIGTSAGAPVTHTALSDGWRRCGILEVARRPATPTGRATRVILRLRGIDREDPWRVQRSTDGVDIATEPRPTAMADLVERIPYDGRIRHVRDRAYFEWRFRNPLSTFRFLFVGAPSLDGYMVLQNHSERGRRPGTAIVDWEGRTDTARAALLSAAVKAFGHQDLFISINDLDADQRRHLGRLGFVEPPSDPDTFRPGVIARSLGTGPWQLGSRDLTDFGDWDWRDIYSDNF